MNHPGDQVVAPAANGELRVRAHYRLDSRNCAKAVFSEWVGRSESDGSFRTVSADEPRRRVHVDDPPVLDDGYPVAQPLGLLHQMSGQENGLAALADAPHQVPDGPPRLRV